MYICIRMYEHMHVCVYVDLRIYEFVSLSTFNQMQILTKLDTMSRHCRTHKGKINVSKKKKKIGWRAKFVVGETKITLSL